MAKEEPTEVAIGCGMIFVMLPLSILLRAFVLVQLWHWFVVPLGVVSIGMAHAYGLAALVSLLNPQKIDKYDEEEGVLRGAIKATIISLLLPLIIWFVGWCCYCAMH